MLCGSAPTRPPTWISCSSGALAPARPLINRRWVFQFRMQGAAPSSNLNVEYARDLRDLVLKVNSRLFLKIQNSERSARRRQAPLLHPVPFMASSTETTAAVRRAAASAPAAVSERVATTKPPAAAAPAAASSTSARAVPSAAAAAAAAAAAPNLGDGQYLGLGMSALVPVSAASLCVLIALIACTARLVLICSAGPKRRRRKKKGGSAVGPLGYTGDVQGALMAANPDDANLSYYDEDGIQQPSPKRGGHKYLGHLVGEAKTKKRDFPHSPTPTPPPNTHPNTHPNHPPQHPPQHPSPQHPSPQSPITPPPIHPTPHPFLSRRSPVRTSSSGRPCRRM